MFSSHFASTSLRARYLRPFLYLFLLFGFAQAVSPLENSWMVTPAEAVVVSTGLMSHQPEAVTLLHDLWSSHAQYMKVASTETAMFQAEVNLDQDSIVPFNDGAVNLFVEEGTFADPVLLQFEPVLQQGRSTESRDGSITPYEESYFRFRRGTESRNHAGVSDRLRP